MEIELGEKTPEWCPPYLERCIVTAVTQEESDIMISKSEMDRTWKVERNISVVFKSHFSSHRAVLDEPQNPLFCLPPSSQHIAPAWPFPLPCPADLCLETASKSQKLCTWFLLPGRVALGPRSCNGGDAQLACNSE